MGRRKNRSCFQDGGENNGKSSSLLFFLSIILSVHSSSFRFHATLALDDTREGCGQVRPWKWYMISVLVIVFIMEVIYQVAHVVDSYVLLMLVDWF